MSPPQGAPGQTVVAQSPLNVIWAASILLDAPLAFSALFFTDSLPLLNMNNTSIVLAKLLAAVLLSVSVSCLLVSGLPDFLPGKRALAILLVLYHAGFSSIFLQAPRFVPVSFGELAERFGVTPERALGCAHGTLGLLVTAWWQVTIPAVQAAKSGKLG